MHVDFDGVGVQVEGGLETTQDVIEMARDITIVKMRAKRITFRAIGRYLGLPPMAVYRRYQRIPARAREYYSKKPLGWLDGAG